MKEIILIKDGEIALKGLNRSSFEDMLCKNIRQRIKPFGAFEIKKSQSTITVAPLDDYADIDAATDEISRVFGIAGYSRAAVAEKDMNEILELAPIYLEEQLNDAKTFKVEAKRSDKKFPLKSPEISAIVGGKLLECFPHLQVDVKNPDITVTVEIREKAYIRGNQLKGAGGMPCGSSGRALLLISGGIDSPVAAYMMAKRGLQLVGIHFASPPYTSLRAEEKVHDLLSKVARYSGKIYLHTVPFTEIQEMIREKCPEELFTIIMRRFMMRLSNMLADTTDCHAHITGESVAQVASQTLLAIGCTDAVAEYPVFRPCVGMDKQEIIAISRKIETFDISIQPFEDCCTVFTPKHPKTRPDIKAVEEAEKALDIEGLCQRAFDGIKRILITADGVQDE